MDEETKKEWDRYLAAVHAVQTGVAYRIANLGPNDAGATPKHLRVGIDTQKVELGAITRLLVAKGICTDEEVIRALADAMESEKAAHERELGFRLG